MFSTGKSLLFIFLQKQPQKIFNDHLSMTIGRRWSDGEQPGRNHGFIWNIIERTGWLSNWPGKIESGGSISDWLKLFSVIPTKMEEKNLKKKLRISVQNRSLELTSKLQLLSRAAALPILWLLA